MRIELAGTLIHPAPLIIRFDANATFYPTTYMELDFTHFEVICIGGGGGMGGGIDTGSVIKNYGGSGGGGGFHRVRGLLSALPITCPVVIGLPGVFGTGHPSDPALTTNGGDGGYSSFNGTTCQASGGKGGKRAQSNSTTAPTLADGGDGGVGGRTNAGGGALGGVYASTPGRDGTYFSYIGQGGGGGAGGVEQYGVGVLHLATAGGRGSYNPGDTSVYGPGGAPNGAFPGNASGAKASPLNGLPTVYGQSQMSGVVVLRLTAE